MSATQGSGRALSEVEQDERAVAEDVRQAALGMAEHVLSEFHHHPTNIELVIARALLAAEQERAALREALAIADREASVAHDAIWDKTVEGTQILHDNDLPTSAQSAIWRLHEAVRPLLAQPASRDASEAPRP